MTMKVTRNDVLKIELTYTQEGEPKRKTQQRDANTKDTLTKGMDGGRSYVESVDLATGATAARSQIEGY